MDNSFKLSDADLKNALDSLDETGGFLIKEKEFRYLIEYFVNKDRRMAKDAKKQCPLRCGCLDSTVECHDLKCLDRRLP